MIHITFANKIKVTVWHQHLSFFFKWLLNVLCGNVCSPWTFIYWQNTAVSCLCSLVAQTSSLASCYVTSSFRGCSQAIRLNLRCFWHLQPVPGRSEWDAPAAPLSRPWSSHTAETPAPSPLSLVAHMLTQKRRAREKNQFVPMNYINKGQ